MTKRNKTLIAFLILLIGLVSITGIFAQDKKDEKEEKVTGTITIIENSGSGEGSGVYKREPYLGLEPCAKETPGQISELENAPDKDKQLEILVKRIGDDDRWIRACSIYRLGEFRDAAKPALPVIIKLLRDEEDSDVWIHVDKALWKVPPESGLPIQERIQMLNSPNVYTRIYGVYTLSYFKPAFKGSETSKKKLDALIQATKDEDITVSWLAVIGIKQLGHYGIDTSKAIPVLSELIKGDKLNPIHPLRAFIPMREKALPAAPLLFDILYNAKKYAGETDEDNTRSYSLYLTSAMVLGGIGESLVPLLEKEIEKEPFAILEILGNIRTDLTLPILYKAMKHENPEVRKKAIEELPGFTSSGAIEAISHLLTAIEDIDLEVQQAAVNKIGNIGIFTKDKSPELRSLIRTEVIPTLIKKLDVEGLDCYSALSIGDLGEDAESAIPVLDKIIQKDRGTHCAEIALYKIGEKGRKHLSEEQIKENEERVKRNKDFWNREYNKAKPIKPKKEEKSDENIIDGET